MRERAAGLMAGAAMAVFAASTASAAEQRLTSPDGALKIAVSRRRRPGALRRDLQGPPLLAPSPLGLVLSAGGSLSHGLKITGAAPSSGQRDHRPGRRRGQDGPRPLQPASPSISRNPRAASAGCG